MWKLIYRFVDLIKSVYPEGRTGGVRKFRIPNHNISNGSTTKMKKMKIESTEIEIRGYWVFDGSTMRTDNTTKRIEKLIEKYLIKVLIAENGWEKLFQDPNDNRYWELTYPESEMQGGGPPLLINLSEIEVRQKYGDVSLLFPR